MPETDMDDVTALASILRATVAGLEEHIERRAQEKAIPLIGVAQGKATAAICEAQAQTEEARALLQREQDLTAELRRYVAGRDSEIKEARQARDIIAVALGHSPGPHPVVALAHEVKRVLAERDAVIERLQGEIREQGQGDRS